MLTLAPKLRSSRVVFPLSQNWERGLGGEGAVPERG